MAVTITGSRKFGRRVLAAGKLFWEKKLLGFKNMQK